MADDDAVKRRWQLALNASIKPISAYWRDEARKYHDRDAVWDAFEEMIRNAQQIDSSSAIDCVRPILDSLKRFDESFLALTKGLLDTTLIWGFLYAAIKLANDTEALLYPFTRNLSNLTQDILLLSEHGRKSTAPEQLQPVMIDTYLEFSEFLSAAVEKLSPDPTFQTDEASRKKDLSTACGASKAKIDEFHDRLEKLSALARRKTFDKSTVQQTNPPDSQLDPLFAKLPCRLLPSGTNSRFFDRTEIFALIDKEFLEPIDKTLRPKADAGKICSFSLHGLGGVGKSEIALQYANSRSKYYEAVLWIRCESKLTIQQSVNDIVESLELRDMQPGNSAVNKVALKTWLQQTEAKWLLVYDNAEEEELLTEYWPGGNSGAVLITTRDRTVAVKTSQDITIEEFDELHGSQLLFTLLSKPVDSDDSSAKELAGLLDGLPLAIENIAGLIHSRGISIAEFVKVYQKNRRKVHQISGKTGRSIDTCWRLSFENLNPEGGSEPLPVSILLGILSFLNADSIPMDLFNSSRASVSNLAFLKNDWDFEIDILGALVKLNLVKRGTDMGDISVHRLVQMEYRAYMAHPLLQKVFDATAELLYDAFPKQKVGEQMHSYWHICGLYLSHGEALLDAYRLHKSEGKRALVPCVSFLRLLTNCAWHLIETARYGQCLSLLDKADEVWKELGDKDEYQYYYAHLQNHYGVANHWCGNFEKSQKAYENVNKIYEKMFPDGHFERYNIYLNLGNLCGSLSQTDKSLEFHLKSLEHISETNRVAQDATAYLGLGRAYYYVNNLVQAEDALKKAQEANNTLENWFINAHVVRVLGNIAFHRKDYKTAREKYELSKKLLVPGYDKHQMMGAAHNRLGCLELHEGNIDQAISCFNAALEIANYNQFCKGYRARALFMLSTALREKPDRREDALAKHQDAKTLRREILGNAYTPDGDDLQASYDSLVVVHVR